MLHLVKRRLDRAPTTQQVDKARALLEEGIHDFAVSQEADQEYEIRKRASLACEKVFHSLVIVADLVLGRESRGHTPRIVALEDMGRTDLAHLYERAKDALHTDGYYGQELTERQRRRLREIQEAVERELEKLA